MKTVDKLRDVLEAMAARRGSATPDALSAYQRAREEARGVRSSGLSPLDPTTRPTESKGSEGASELVAMESREANRSSSTTRRLRVALASAAAVAVVLVGLSTLNWGNADPVETASFGTGGSTVVAPTAVGTPAVIVTPTTVAAEPVDPWSFEVDLIEVEGLWSVDADEAAAWGVPISFYGQPSPGSDRLFKLDLASNEVVSEVPIPVDGVFVAVGDDAVWVGHADGRLSRVDPVTESVVATIDVGGSVLWIDIGTDAVWVANGERLVRVDPVTNTVAAEIETGGAWVAMEGAGGVWAWVPGDNAAVRVDPSTNGVVAAVEFERSGLGFGVGPDAVWRADDDGSVSRIDPDTNSVGVEIEIEAPDGSATRPTGAEVVAGSVWVPFDYSCDPGPCEKGLARIDAETSTVVATGPLPGDSGVAIKVGPSTVWVAGDGQLALVNI